MFQQWDISLWPDPKHFKQRLVLISLRGTQALVCWRHMNFSYDLRAVLHWRELVITDTYLSYWGAVVVPQGYRFRMVHLVLKSFLPVLRHSCVLVSSASAVMVSYTNHQANTRIISLYRISFEGDGFGGYP